MSQTTTNAAQSKNTPFVDQLNFIKATKNTIVYGSEKIPSVYFPKDTAGAFGEAKVLNITITPAA